MDCSVIINGLRDVYSNRSELADPLNLIADVPPARFLDLTDSWPRNIEDKEDDMVEDLSRLTILLKKTKISHWNGPYSASFQPFASSKDDSHVPRFH